MEIIVSLHEVGKRIKYCNNGKHLKQVTEFNKNLVNTGLQKNIYSLLDISVYYSLTAEFDFLFLNIMTFYFAKCL